MTDDELFAAHFGLRSEPGYVGAFTRQTVLGAFRPGTRMVKIKTEDGDGRALGALGTVLGSIADPIAKALVYFIEWDEAPGYAVAVMAWKLAYKDGHD